MSGDACVRKSPRFQPACETDLRTLLTWPCGIRSRSLERVIERAVEFYMKSGHDAMINILNDRFSFRAFTS